jgi:hypothetical protein
MRKTRSLQVKDNQDIKLQYADGDYPLTQGKIHAGALVYLTDSLRSAKSPLEQSFTTATPRGASHSLSSSGPFCGL